MEDFFAKFLTNRSIWGVLKNTKKNFWGPTGGVLVMNKIQLTQNNWKIMSIFYGVATRAIYFWRRKKWHKKAIFPVLQKLTHINIEFVFSLKSLALLATKS